jgi:sugar porter (SP) family MFS transporter
MSPNSNQKTGEQAGAWYLYAVSFVAAVGGFLFGYDLSIISGALIFLRSHFGLTPTMEGFAMSIAIVGCIFGCPFAMWSADALGRKLSLIIAAGFFLVSSVGSAMPFGIWDFGFWRMLGGIGVGIAAVVSPMYIAEIAPARLRGRLITVYQLSVVVGINLSVLVSFALSFGGHWRLMFLSNAGPTLLLAAGLFFVPHSPRWLAVNGRFDEALAVLAKINGLAEANVVMNDIQMELKEEKGGFAELLRPGLRRAVLVGVGIMIFAQINGVNMMILYAPTILQEAGFNTASNAIFNSMFINLALLFSTVLSFWLVDRFGRRNILMVGVAAMAGGHLLMSAASLYGLGAKVSLLAMIICAAAFTLSLAPLGWVIVSEIYPNRVRGKAMGVVCTCLYAASAVCAQLFPMVTNWFQKQWGTVGGSYLVFAAICASCVFFVWQFVPETKGLTLEKIADFWLHYPKNSNDARRT